MKQLLIIVMGVFLLMGCAVSTETHFFVQGNCEDCKEIIEAKVNSLEGIDSVGWDFESSILFVKYFASEVAPEKLQQAVSEVGFDTQFYPANADARAKLPVCCQQPIDRKLKRIEPKLNFGH